MARKTTADRGRDILKSKEKFPDFNMTEYDHSLLLNLNFYRIEIDNNRRKREWAYEYWKKEGKDLSALAKLNDGNFSTAGAIAHMILGRGIDLDIKHRTFLDRKYTELVALEKSKMNDTDEDEEPAVVVSKEEKEEAVSKIHIAEFEAGVDMFFAGKSFDAKGYLIRNNVKASVMKLVADAMKPKVKEIKEAAAGNDAQLVEGYSHLTKRQLNKFLEYVQGLIDSCEVAQAISKASRKPRAKKVKPPSELVKNVKFMAEDASLKLKSEHPEKIVKSTEVWLYNVKLRRLFRYVALAGMQLTVKGTTIINVDQEKSGGKIVRKPETMLAGIHNFTRKQINDLYNSIRGTESKAAGRLNEDTIVLKCY